MYIASFVLNVSFCCKKCDHFICSRVTIPEPDFDNFEDGGDDFDSEEIYCDSCEHEHTVDIFCNYSKNHFSASLDGTEVGDDSPYYDEEIIDELAWAILDNDHHNIITVQLNNSEKLNKRQEELEGLTTTLNVMNYAHIVAAIEGYLGAVFIKYVMTHDDLLKKFILENTDYKEIKFKATDLVSNPDFIRSNVKEYLDKFIFHRVDKVKPLYKAVLGCDLGNINWLGKAVQIRHDCVHRAGITQSNKKLDITEEDIEDLIENARQLSFNLKNDLEVLDKKLIPDESKMDFHD